ncbi:MAG: hypothetical protein R2827_15305 [Bdellovibrionales bacterium]
MMKWGWAISLVVHAALAVIFWTSTRRTQAPVGLAIDVIPLNTVEEN